MRKFLFLYLICIVTSGFSQSRPFPQNEVYAYGLKPSNYPLSELVTAYNTWKDNYVVSCGAAKRVAYDNPGTYDYNVTVSEGQAYGMLIAAYMGDKALFDDLFSFYKKFPYSVPGWSQKPLPVTIGSETMQLMAWKVACDSIIDNPPATDADEDAAFSLIIAYEQWGDAKYLNSAKALIKAMESYIGLTTDGTGRTYFEPGDWNGDYVAPDYQAPCYYRVFAEYSDNPEKWNKLADDVYLLYDIHTSHWNVNLISDFCMATTGIPFNDYRKHWGADACRGPWRLGLDYLWYGKKRAEDYSNYFADFAISQNYDIRSSYTFPNGEPGPYQGTEYDGAFAVACMVKDQTVIDAQTQAFKEAHDGGYYQKTLEVIYGLVLSGNFWQPASPGSCNIKMSKSIYEMPNKAGFVTLTITSGEAFTVLNNTDWIKTTLNGSNLSIYINENNANLNRNGTLTIAGCVNRNISIVQNGKLGQCTQELIPASGNWILRNEYSNQNGSTFSTENNAMKLTYPQWAQDNYYLIQTKSTKLETGKKYSVSVDIQGTNVSSISDIKVGFASGETWNGPTGYLVPLQSVGGQISNSSFTSKSIELITTIAGTGYLTMYITLNNQPSQSASYYFKNINICEKDILEAVGQNVISNNIDESKSLPVFAYPNPVQNRLHFPFSNYFQLSDLYGKVIFRGQDSSELNTDLLAPGLYVFNFTSNGKETQQLIIKK